MAHRLSGRGGTGRLAAGGPGRRGVAGGPDRRRGSRPALTTGRGRPDAERLREAGPAEAARYTWADTVTTTLEGYQAALV